MTKTAAKHAKKTVFSLRCIKKQRAQRAQRAQTLIIKGFFSFQ